MSVLDQTIIDRHRQQIEQAIIPIMQKMYLGDRDTGVAAVRPGYKSIENIVAYYDYYATGISVLAKLAARGDDRAFELIKIIQNNTEHYCKYIYNHPAGEVPMWSVPLRRLLLHIALAYQNLLPIMNNKDQLWYEQIIEQQVPAAIEHCKHFLPGVKDLHLNKVNNHTAVFMQGVYYCGKSFGRSDWSDMAYEFAERYLANGHPDGYFEEFTNAEREGGPSLIYTPLTAGCLYDVLDGKAHRQDKFIKAGHLFRSLINHDFAKIPIADERTNASDNNGAGYGLALHSLTAEGRYFITHSLESLNCAQQHPETLAVVDHELDLMIEGPCTLPENLKDAPFRLSLPLGIIRKHNFTAGISALRALNRVIRPREDYALDQQNMLYLSHKTAGVILTGVKSKNNPAFSTFRIGNDAYTIRTGKLEAGEDWAEAHLHYQTFKPRIRWELGENARLILTADTDQTITTCLPITDTRYLNTDTGYEIVELNGFSPYTQGNKTDRINAAVIQWTRKLVIEFPGNA